MLVLARINHTGGNSDRASIPGISLSPPYRMQLCAYIQLSYVELHTRVPDPLPMKATLTCEIPRRMRTLDQQLR